MEANQVVYTRARKEFGRPCYFSDHKSQLIVNIAPNKNLLDNFTREEFTSKSTKFSKVQAAHDVNTETVTYVTRGINHNEGGWPKDINPSDPEQTLRYKRKIEKDDMAIHAITQLAHSMEHNILQNNSINIYQHYYTDVERRAPVQKTHARTINRYRQPTTGMNRPVTSLSWSTDDGSKIASANCQMRFQTRTLHRSCNDCYIWNVENPNRPELVLTPPLPCCSLIYNPKDPFLLCGGLFSGQVTYWDLRKGPKPVEISTIEDSHRDPVNNILWINSKTGTEFFSAATDGIVKWWDIRNMSQPTESLILDISDTGEQSLLQALGASSLEYEPTIPTRFMVGCENGMVISCNRKGKTPQEKLAGRFSAYVGPVVALNRNPSSIKNFLTVGDWTARIWSEECKESSIVSTPPYQALLCDGAWSCTRSSVFFLVRDDGVLDAWDLLQSYEEPNIRFKVSDFPLAKVLPHEHGRLVAVGNKEGNLYLIQFSDNLAENAKNDKQVFTSNLERESKREKILEARRRELKLKRQPVDDKKGTDDELDPFQLDADTLEAEKDYMAEVERVLFSQLNLEKISDTPFENEENGENEGKPQLEIFMPQVDPQASSEELTQKDGKSKKSPKKARKLKSPRSKSGPKSPKSKKSPKSPK